MALKTDKMERDVVSKIDELLSPSEVFRLAFHAPLISEKLQFDFESKDTHGLLSAPEGALRSLVFASTSSSHVCTARGASSAVHGVTGMAGVGKTTALIGLAHDLEIRAHFVDGVLYMSLSATAISERV